MATETAHTLKSSMENPYQSPTTISAEAEPLGRTPSWLRGFAFAVPLFFAGAAIPLLIPAIYFAVEWYSGGEIDLELFDSALTLPSVGCGMLFSFAAVRNYSPSEDTGYVSCLMCVGIFAIIGIIFTALVSLVFSLESQTFDSDAWFPLKILLAVSIPTFYTLMSTNKRMAVPAPPIPARSEQQ